MRTNCSYCGDSTSKSNNVVERNERNFCNRDCRDRYFGNGKTKDEWVDKVYRLVEKEESLTKSEIADRLGLNERSVYNYLRELREANKVELVTNSKYRLKQKDSIIEKIVKKEDDREQKIYRRILEVCDKLSLPPRASAKAIKIFREATSYKAGVWSGRKAKTIVTACVYFATKFSSHRRTRRQVLEVTGGNKTQLWKIEKILKEEEAEP